MMQLLLHLHKLLLLFLHDGRVFSKNPAIIY